MSPLFLAGAAMAAIVLAALLSRRTGIATPLVLLVLGLAVSFAPAVPTIVLEPEWVLAGVLPPLLYAASVQVPVVDLRRNLGMIAWLSVVLVIGSALVVGWIVHLLVPAIPFAAGVALGAVISPTDAVAATSIGKRLGLPHRVMTVLEGESLFNDASALVLLRTAIVALAGGFSFWEAAGDFARAVILAVVIGLIVGALGVWARSRISDPVLTTCLSFLVPFLAFLPAEEIEASGVVAVVVAGITTGHLSPRLLDARQRSTERTNWATVAFLVENGVFLLMGMQLKDLADAVVNDGDSLSEVMLLTGVLVAVLLVLRLGGVGLFMVATRGGTARRAERMDSAEARLAELPPQVAIPPRRLAMFRRRLERGRADVAFEQRSPITRPGGLVIAWSGMRGVVTLAAALTLPTATPLRSEIIAVAFMVAIVTLLVFGTSLPLLIRRLGLGGGHEEQIAQESAVLIRDVHEQAITSMRESGALEIGGESVDEQILGRLDAAARWMLKDGGKAIAPERGERGEHRDTAERGVEEGLSPFERARVLRARYLEAMREALLDERSRGAYSSQALAVLQRGLDAEELRLTRD